MSVKVFYLHREEDVSGVSGTGRIAEGIEFSDGHVVVHWPSATPSTNHYVNIKQMLKVHGHGGKLTVRVLFEEPDPDSPSATEKEAEPDSDSS